MLGWRNSPFLRLFAIVALVVQFLASYGHVHFGDGHGVLANSAPLDCPAGSSGPCAPPTDNEHDAQCPICLAAYQIATAVMPGLAEAPIFDVVAVTLAPFTSTGFAEIFAGYIYEARGPPRAS